MKGKGKASSIPLPLVAPTITSTFKGKGKGKGRAKEEVVEPARPASPTKPSSVPYPSNEASTSQLPATSKSTSPDKSKALKTRRPSIPSAQKMPIGLFPGDGDSDGSLTSLPSEFQSSDPLTSDDGKGDDDDALSSDGEPDVLFISSKRHPSQALSSSEDNSEMDSDSDSGTFSSTTNGLDEDMDDDEDEMLMEEEDFVRRDERSRRGGGNGGGRGRKGGWENVRDREDGFEVSSWGGGTDGYSHDEDLDDDDEEDDDDDDETDAFGLGGRGGGGGVKVLTFDAAGARTGSWSEDSSDEDEEQELWFDGLSDFDLEEDVLVGADGIQGIIPVEGEEMYIESFDLDALSSQSLARPVDLGGASSSSSRRTSGERKAAAHLDLDYELELDLEGDLAMAELLSGGVGDGEPGSMLIMEDWDGQLVFGPGSVDGSGGAFEFATESEGDSDGRKDADRMEDLWFVVFLHFARLDRLKLTVPSYFHLQGRGRVPRRELRRRRGGRYHRFPPRRRRGRNDASSRRLPFPFRQLLQRSFHRHCRLPSRHLRTSLTHGRRRFLFRHPNSSHHLHRTSISPSKTSHPNSRSTSTFILPFHQSRILPPNLASHSSKPKSRRVSRRSKQSLERTHHGLVRSSGDGQPSSNRDHRREEESVRDTESVCEKRKRSRERKRSCDGRRGFGEEEERRGSFSSLFSSRRLLFSIFC